MRSHRTPLTGFARRLRTDSTDAELHLWKSLRNRNIFSCKFRRQFPIGPYIADFVCLEHRLVIEVDGGQHNEQRLSKDRERDIFKTAPREGRLDTLSITLAMTVFVLFGLMYLIEDISTGASQSFAAQRIKSILTDPVYRDISILFKNNEHKWVIVLIDVLWVFNIPLWLYFIKHFIKPMAKKSLEDCSKNRNYAGIKRIEIMESYLVGKWQKWRFGAGLAYLLIVDLFYVGFLRNTDDGTTHLAIPICGFVLAAEGWVWLMRFKVKFALECVDEIVDRYRLVRKPASRDNLEQA